MKRVLLLMSMVWLATPVTAQEQRPTWADGDGVKEIRVTKEKRAITIKAKTRIATTLIFPEDEHIVRRLCGDVDNWVIEPKENDPQLANYLTIKSAPVAPQFEQTPTNLMVVTDKRLYLFWLVPITKGTPDLQVTLITDDVAPVARKWVPISEFEAVQSQLLEAQAKLQARVEPQGEGKPVDMPEPTKFYDYSPVPYEKPFKVKAIYHDGKFTYIQTDASELPGVYEIKDGKPSVLDPHPDGNGLLVVYKVIDEGVLTLGNKKQVFKLVKGN